MIRGSGCAIRPAPTQKWAAATYLAIGTTRKELRRDATTKNRSHKLQIYTTISPGCVISCTPGDKSMVRQERPKLSPGCRILWGGVISYARVISCCVSYGINTPPKKQRLELLSASGGLAVPPRPIRTAALRHAGERAAVGASPRRGGSAEIALPGTARLAPGVAGNCKKLQMPPSPRAL